MRAASILIGLAFASALALGTHTARASGCEVHGVVSDADAMPVPGVQIVLEQGDTVRRTATDSQGRYRFVAVGPGTVQVSLVVADAAHDPAWFRLSHESQGIEIASDRFSTDAGACERNFDLASPDERYPEAGFPRQWWADAITLHRGLSEALSLTTRLGIDLGPTPLEVRAFYAASSPDTSFWVGTPSYAPDSDREPFIGLGMQASTRADRGWPGNREDHEAGHYALARGLGGVHPRARNDTNHGGYWANTTSADAWGEGFASFYAVMVAKHVRERARPQWLTVQGAVLDLELDYGPWDLGGLEEVAVAGLLVDLEDGPADYATPPNPPGLSIVQTTLLPAAATQPTVDLAADLVVGQVQGTEGPVVGTVLELELLGPSNGVVGQTRAVVVAQDVDDAGAPVDGLRGRFVAVVPRGVSATAARLREAPGVDDDPVDLELEALWRVIANFTSSKAESNGRLFDVDDLHTALAQAFGGKDADGDGTDDIEQLFIAHGLFGDHDGNRQHDAAEPVGQTGHPGGEIAVNGRPTPRPALDPRLRMVLPHALRAAVDLAEPHATLIVSTDAPGRAPVTYIPVPDLDRQVVLIPPPSPIGDAEAGTITVLALAPGKQPVVVARLDAAEFLAEIERHTEGHITLSADFAGLAPAAERAHQAQRLAWGIFVGGAVTLVFGIGLALFGLIRGR